MVIIVEGPDGAGKTEICTKLRIAHPDYALIHFTPPKPGEDQFLKYAQPIIDYRAAPVLILDRSWYSEFVYGPIMRNKIALTDEHNRAFEALVMQYGGAHILYVTASLNMLWKRCCKRGESFITSKELLGRISERYDEVMESIPGIPVIKVVTG